MGSLTLLSFISVVAFKAFIGSLSLSLMNLVVLISMFFVGLPLKIKLLLVGLCHMQVSLDRREGENKLSASLHFNTDSLQGL